MGGGALSWGGLRHGWIASKTRKMGGAGGGPSFPLTKNLKQKKKIKK